MGGWERRTPPPAAQVAHLAAQGHAPGGRSALAEAPHDSLAHIDGLGGRSEQAGAARHQVHRQDDQDGDRQRQLHRWGWSWRGGEPPVLQQLLQPGLASQAVPFPHPALSSHCGEGQRHHNAGKRIATPVRCLFSGGAPVVIRHGVAGQQDRTEVQGARGGGCRVLPKRCRVCRRRWQRRGAAAVHQAHQQRWPTAAGKEPLNLHPSAPSAARSRLGSRARAEGRFRACAACWLAGRVSQEQLCTRCPSRSVRAQVEICISAELASAGTRLHSPHYT